MTVFLIGMVIVALLTFRPHDATGYLKAIIASLVAIVAIVCLAASFP